MPEVPLPRIRFALSLEHSDVAQRGFAPSGAAFHRWLPNGRADAIELGTGHPGSHLHVWFKRWGRVIERDNGTLAEVVYVPNVAELTDEAVAMQGRLSSGPLLGELSTAAWSAVERAAVQEGAIGNDTYIALAKRVLEVLVPPLQRLIGSLQTDHGQYWLRDLETWDARKSSIGNYCRSLQLSHSLDGGQSWREFTPSENVISLKGSYSGLAVYRRAHLSRDDWFGLPALAKSFPLDSPALELIGNARELEDLRSDLRTAVVHTATAAEVAVSEFLSRDADGKRYLLAVIPGFENLTAEAKFSIIGAALVRVPHDILVASAPAWDFRHRIVHKGWRPREDDRLAVSRAVASLQQATAALLGRNFRTVSALYWGAIALPELWEEDLARSSVAQPAPSSEVSELAYGNDDRAAPGGGA